MRSGFVDAQKNVDTIVSGVGVRVNEINCDFNVLFVPSKPAPSELGDGRPIGGLVILYHKSLNLTNIMKHENFHFYDTITTKSTEVHK